MNENSVSFDQLNDDYQRIEQAIQYLDAHKTNQPELEEVARAVNLSEFHFQRLFTRWVGISPKRFLQFLTKEHARRLLDRSGSLLEAAYDAGLSGPGRLHDLFVAVEAVTPGEYKHGGAGLALDYGFHPTPLGDCLLAASPRGVTDLVFLGAEGQAGARQQLKQRWPNAELRLNAERTGAMAAALFGFWLGEPAAPLSLHLRGTNFQIKVWEALLRIPPGSVTSYQKIAEQIGRPASARAVGNAVGANPLPVIIPCHRVLHKLGDFSGYRYGVARKKALLGWESAHYGEQ
jgi:AraC family transcriptional regulator of adaptative response/methylated-DNA-[protein]-cysteine methyltransferase